MVPSVTEHMYVVVVAVALVNQFLNKLVLNNLIF
jgi:hypothetical protein